MNNNTVDIGGKFATDVVDNSAVVHLDLRISPRIVDIIQNDPNVIFRGLVEDDDDEKDLKQKSRDTVPLNIKVIELNYDNYFVA
jgi:hypothetical protein